MFHSNQKHVPTTHNTHTRQHNTFVVQGPSAVIGSRTGRDRGTRDNNGNGLTSPQLSLPPLRVLWPPTLPQPDCTHVNRRARRGVIATNTGEDTADNEPRELVLIFCDISTLLTFRDGGGRQRGLRHGRKLKTPLSQHRPRFSPIQNRSTCQVSDSAGL